MDRIDMHRRLAVTAALAMITAVALATPAQAAARDTDHDGMPNRWERAHGLDWRKANSGGDPDHDGISNIKEFRLGQDPRHADGVAQCSALETALGATDPSECGSGSITEFLH
jgi:hypothetical protein